MHTKKGLAMSYTANKEFIPTNEQKEIEGAFNGEILMGLFDESSPYRLAVVAPAGAGKTSTFLYNAEKLQEEAPQKRIGYFVFNRFMADAISRQAYFREIQNTDFFTYHAFLLRHAQKNEKLKSYFYDKNGNFLVDFAKEKYTNKEIAHTSMEIAGSDYHILVEILKEGLKRYSANSDNLTKTVSDLADDILSPKENCSESVRIASSYKKNIGDILRSGADRMLGRLTKKIDKNAVTAKDLIVLFLAQGIKRITRTSKYTKNAYYKEVYAFAKKHNIDLFEEYDAIVVDEWQDADPIFKDLIGNTKKPLMVIGDANQSIYQWRGALNMMEYAQKHFDVLPLTYSFRFANDIAYFSRTILREKGAEMEIYGKYTDTTSSIVSDEVLGYEQVSKEILSYIDRTLGYIIRNNGDLSDRSDLYAMPKTRIAKEVSRYKTAIIARNNATLIDMIFNTVPKMRSGAAAKMQKELVRDVFLRELNKVPDNDIDRLMKGDFPKEIKNMFEFYSGIPYADFAKGKTLRDILSDENMMAALKSDPLLNPMSKKTFVKKIEAALKKADSGNILRIALSSSVSEDFRNIRKAVFPKRIEKKISDMLGVKYSDFRVRKTLRDVLKNEIVQEVLSGTEYAFLLDDEKLCQFEFIAQELSTNKSGSIKSNDKEANIVFSTIHGTKGKDYHNVYVLGDIMLPDKEGVIADEEYNLAYVSVSRTIDKLYFAKTDASPHHPLYAYFMDKKSEIESYLAREYTYTFPHGYTMTIKKTGSDMYAHVFKKEGEYLDTMFNDRPIASGMLVYDITNRANGIKYYNKGGIAFKKLNGDDLLLSKTEKDACSYHYGTGKTKETPSRDNNKIERSMQASASLSPSGR